MNFNKVISLATVLFLMMSVTSCKDSVKEPSKTSSIQPLKTFNLEPSQIVGTMGDEKISAAELKFYYNMCKSKMEREAGVADKSEEEKKEFWESKDNKRKLEENTFKDITELKVMLINAKMEKLELGQDDLETIEYNINLFIREKANSDRALAEDIMKEMYGISIDEYRTIYGDYILAYNKYAYGETAKIKVSDSDIEKRFEADKDQYNKVSVKHILIYTTDLTTNQPLSEEKIAEKKELANEVLKKAQAGESFESLVEQYSEDWNSKQDKGDYTFAKDEANANLVDWAFNAKEGDIGLVETYYGIHIVKLIKYIEATLGNQEKTTITTYIQNEQFDKKVDEMKSKYNLVKNQQNIDALGLF